MLDLGAEWTELTGLPMVFAVWAARAELARQDPAPFLASLGFGMEHIDDIVREEHSKLGITTELARDYLTRNIVFELGPARIRRAVNFSAIRVRACESGRTQGGVGMMTRQEATNFSERRSGRDRNGR